MILEAVAPFRCRDVAFRAAADWELAAYHELRRRVFCDEQRLFTGDDLDAIDAHAVVLVAVSRTAGVVDDVVGGVRTWEDAPGAWWGGRLVTHPDHRGTAGIATGLTRLAVATAARRGARSFHATVQIQNVPLFLRLGWTQLAGVDVRGAPHALMAADLAAALVEPAHDRASRTWSQPAPTHDTTSTAGNPTAHSSSPAWDHAPPTAHSSSLAWDHAPPTAHSSSPSWDHAPPTAHSSSPSWDHAPPTAHSSSPSWDHAPPTAHSSSPSWDHAPPTAHSSSPSWDQAPPIAHSSSPSWDHASPILHRIAA